jgi:hypothetical protein
MKLDDVRRNIQKTGEFSEDYFDIGDKAIIMSILRDKMYSNPIKAICQEIMSNGRDAHREVGKGDLPIEVKLPNRVDTEFYIKDFGPGITPERMTDIFIKYGASTKRIDNVQTGGFGLGAKTPFAYTDTFTIVSITPSESYEEKSPDGKVIKVHKNVLVCRQYIAYIDESGIGKMICASSEVTDEPQGTKISITALEKDFHLFEEWVRHVGKYWEVRPEIKGYPNWKWKEFNREFEGDNWFVEGKSNNYYSQDNIVAIVDGIPYTVNQHSFSMTSEHKRLAGHRIRMFFDVGELSVTANREDLDYGKGPESKTNVKLTERMDEVYDEIREKLQDKIKDSKNLWEAKCNWKKIRNDYNELILSVEWKGVKITHDNMNVRQHGVNAYRFEMKTDNIGGFSLKKKEIWAIDFMTDSIICVDDTGTKRGSSQRVQTLFNDEPDTSFVYAVILPVDPKKAKDALASLDKSDNFEQFDYIKLSTIDKSKVARFGSSGNNSGCKMTRVRQFNPNSYYKSEAWLETEKDLANDTGVYVEIKNREAIINEKRISYTALQTHLNIFGTNRKWDLHGIPTRFVKKAGAGWVKLEDKMRKEFDLLIKDQKVVDECLSLTNIEYSIFGQLYNGSDVFKCLPALLNDTDTELFRYLKLSLECQKNVALQKKITNMARLLGITIEVKNSRADLKDLYDYVIQRYPLLRNMNFYCYDAKAVNKMAEKVADYINGIELLKESQLKKSQEAIIPDLEDRKEDEVEKKELQTA